MGTCSGLTTWGESHGDASRCGRRLPAQAAARCGGHSEGTRPAASGTERNLHTAQGRRQSGDTVGRVRGRDARHSILIGVWNGDARSKDYDHMRRVYRPSHADYSYDAKYGIRNWKGGGRASARETIGRVAAGAIAKKILAREFGVEIVGYVKQEWKLHADVDPSTVTQEDVESNIARCPDQDMAALMIERIKEARKDGDSLGGVVECVARGVPVGLGEPVFDKPGSRPSQVGAVHARVQGLRGRLRLRRHYADRLAAQRPVLQRGRAHSHSHQQLRRYTGRHQQRRRTSSYARRSSRLPRLCASSRRSMSMATR